MNFSTISNDARSQEAQEQFDYVRDESGFAIKATGHYTIAELQLLLRALTEANQHFDKNITAAIPFAADDHGGTDVVISGRRASFGSVKGYCEYNNATYGEEKSVDEAVARAVARKEKLHWINLASSVMTSSASANHARNDHWAKAPQLKIGQVVTFDGIVFRIDQDFNNNFRLTEV